jgi:hypothetical protein
MARDKALSTSIDELQGLCEKSTKAMEAMELAVPIKAIGHKRHGSRGQTSWPLYIWELIMEQLVIGVPPKAVFRSIAGIVKTFSPSTVINNPIHLATILRARTVLLVVVQTLASYRLGKANKWGQLFHDATSRRQVSFQNLVISIEEDQLFK